MAYVVGLTKTQLRHPLTDVPDIRYFPEAALQTFVSGDLVNLLVGKVVLCSNDTDTVLGIAMADATGVTDTPVPVAVFEPTTEILLPVYDSTSGSPVRAATSDTYAGNDYSLVRVSAGKWAVDLKATSTFHSTKIKGVWLGDTARNNADPYDTRRVQVGDQGRVIASIKDSYLQFRNTVS